MAISQVNETSSLLPKTGKALSESEILNSATPLTPAIIPPGRLTADADAEVDADYHAETEIEDKPAVWTVISILLSGVLLANADTSLIVASSQQIASEFDSLSAAAWLITTYILAQCAFQPLYGKFSDIFGRKSIFAIAYILFAAGCFLCGVAQTWWQVLAGRVISGAGGAGVISLVFIVIADMVPPRQVATLRGYVNVVATLGRALGAPLGGWLCDTVTWRWCFLGQTPLTMLGLALLLWKLPGDTDDPYDDDKNTLSYKIRRVDGFGAITIMLTIIGFLLALEFAGDDLPLIYTLPAAVVCCVSGIFSYYIERYWAAEPILPFETISRPAIYSCFLLYGFQLAANFALFYAVPLYFQLVEGDTVSKAGARLIAPVVGNAISGFAVGFVVYKTGRYKLLTTVNCVLGIVGSTLVAVRWRGATSWWETLYTVLTGFASGTVGSTTFVHLTASVEKHEMAIAGSALYLTGGIFQVIGVQSSTGILRFVLRTILDTELEGYPLKSQIIEMTVRSVRSIRELPSDVQAIVTRAYINSLTSNFVAATAFATIALLIGLAIRERRL